MKKYKVFLRISLVFENRKRSSRRQHKKSTENVVVKKVSSSELRTNTRKTDFCGPEEIERGTGKIGSKICEDGWKAKRNLDDAQV